MQLPVETATPFIHSVRTDAHAAYLVVLGDFAALLDGVLRVADDRSPRERLGSEAARLQIDNLTSASATERYRGFVA